MAPCPLETSRRGVTRRREMTVTPEGENYSVAGWGWAEVGM